MGKSNDYSWRQNKCKHCCSAPYLLYSASLAVLSWQLIKQCRGLGTPAGIIAETTVILLGFFLLAIPIGRQLLLFTSLA